MSRYGSLNVTDPSSDRTVVVQNADPEALSILINDAIAALPAGYTVVGLTLAGAGDGSMFTVMIEAGPSVDVIGGFLAPPSVSCFLAADAEALERVARASIGTGVLADVQVAGASKGPRFMGMVVSGVIPATDGAPVSLFGDGSDGDVVVSAPDTPISAILNARSITILPGASIRVPPESHCLLRASQQILVNGPINGDATTSFANLIDSPVVVQFIGSTAEGGSGGGGGGGAGASGDGSNGNQGNDGSGKVSAVGFSHGTGSVGGSQGAGGIGGVGANGGDATLGIAGVDITDLENSFHLYPAGPGGCMLGSIPGPEGRDGVDGGAGSGGTPGGVGGSHGVFGLGASAILLVAPLIVLNALVSSNGGDGGAAPLDAMPGDAAPGGSNEGGGGGGSGGGGSAGGAGGMVMCFYGTLTETVAPQANPGAGGAGAPGAPGGAGDGTGFAGGDGGAGVAGATGSPGFVIRQRIL